MFNNFIKIVNSKFFKAIRVICYISKKYNKRKTVMSNNFDEKIKPFFFVEHENSASLCLNVGEYKAEIFEERADEGFEGGGYDWQSLALVFLDEKVPELKEFIDFDSEASMFCAYSSDIETLKTFALLFKDACENDELIRDLFSRAELD